MDVRLPDGTVIQNVPEGTTKAQLIEKLKGNGFDISGLETKKEVSMGRDVLDSVASALPKAAAGIVGLPSAAMELIAAGARKVGGGLGLETKYAHPMFGNLGDLAKSGLNMISPLHKPETVPGRYAGAATEGALMAGVNPAMAFSGARAGIGSELGGDLTDNSPWGRLIGGLALGAAPDAIAAIRGRAGERVAEATKGMSPAEWEAAIARQRAAAAQGVQVTGPEALANKNLLSQQLLLENSPRTAAQFEPVMKARPGQVTKAVTGVLDDIGTRPADPMAVGARVQDAASSAIDKTRQAVNAQARPSYEASVTANNKLSAELMVNLYDEHPAIRKVVADVLEDPLSGIPKGTAPQSMLVVDAAKKRLDDMIEVAKRAGENNKVRVLASAKDKLVATADEAFPDYGIARGIVQRGTQKYVEPLSEGAVGKLKETADPVAQFTKLTDPKRVTVETVKTAAKSVKMSDPNAYRDLVRQGLQNELDDSLKMLQSGGQEFSGARFARSVRETPQTSANIQEMLKQLPDGSTRVKAFNNLVDTLEMTGNRLPVGSRTAFNQLQLDEMSAQGLTRIASNPVGGVASWWDRVSANMTGQDLAKVFTDKDSVKKLRELAFTKPGSAKARSVISSLISADKAEE
jgi:hypothetical protein